MVQFKASSHCNANPMLTDIYPEESIGKCFVQRSFTALVVGSFGVGPLAGKAKLCVFLFCRMSTYLFTPSVHIVYSPIVLREVCRVR